MKTRTTSTSTDEPGPAAAAAANGTLLVVEDDGVLRGLFVQLFTHHGYTVVEAGDGVEAVRLAQAHRPDVILMDINLPRVSGLTATEVLKQTRATADTPVIAISAYNPSERDILAAGCIRFLSKPVEPRKLLEAVAEARALAQPAV